MSHSVLVSSVMRSFGKRPNAIDYGVVLQFGKPPVSCRILERTLRVVRLAVADPKSIAQRFTLLFDNAQEKLVCQVISTGEDYVMARYSAQEGADREIGLTRIGTTLGESSVGKVLLSLL